MNKIKKILIANRGEIAVRIHRSAKEMGIETVAVYSDLDRTAPHVLLCDYAFPLHGITSAETYLDIQKILTVAKNAKVDAIHPGYGFLSEKEEFAYEVTNAGFIFIGPTAKTIGLLGSKTAARELLRKHNLPIVPGTTQPIQTTEEAKRVAQSIGFPVLIKASDGGGGKGMRRVDTEADLESAIERARNEARKAFGDDRVYIEKLITRPKHIEIQILADSYGTVVHLGERECSIQRRHQKVVEESPSVALSAELREKMGQTAIAIAKAAQYVNAGTIEFLLDEHKNFYFLEVNTRIQVEHPVTEMIYGVDIVKEQIRIAQGEPLSFSQHELTINGHAIECRICAEDSDNDFLPSTGTVTSYYPSEGHGVRNDSGIRAGMKISMHYDPMVAKLIVHAKSRADAIDKMKRALTEYKLNGIKTTIPFCLFVMNHNDFIQGTYDINFVEKNYRPTTKSLDEKMAVAILAAYRRYSSNNKSISITYDNKNISKWRLTAFND